MATVAQLHLPVRKDLKPRPRPNVDRAQLRKDIAARYENTFRALGS